MKSGGNSSRCSAVRRPRGRCAGGRSNAMPVIGFLNSSSPDTEGDRVRAYHSGLRETGYVEGRNVTIEYRWADGQNERLPSLAADLVKRDVSLIVTGGTPATLAAKAATTKIPIVFILSTESARGRSRREPKSSWLRSFHRSYRLEC